MLLKKALYTNSSKTIYIFCVIGMLLIMAGCTGSTASRPAQGANLNDIYLTIVSHTPLPDEVVFADSTITVTFSHDIDMSTVNSSTFYVLDERSLIVSGTYEYLPASKTLKFIPADGFQWGGKYTVYVTTGIYNTLHVHMQEGYSWSFTIAPFYDIQKPRIDTNTVQPVGNNVDKNAVISFRIIDNGHIDIASIPLGVAIQNESEQYIEYAYTYIAENKEIRCQPVQPLMEGQSYHVTVSDALHDESGNPLENPYSWQFTVQAVAPYVVSLFPANGQTNVSIGEYITVVFSESIKEDTLPGGILVEGAVGSIAGTIQYDRGTCTATFIPDHLEFYTDYTVTIANTITDICGIPLDHNYISTFKTMQENIQPHIISITPESPVDVSSVFHIQFSEQMNVQSLYDSIMLFDSYGNSFPVMIDYDEETHICTVTPHEYLTGFYEYTLEITTEATDIHGNPLQQVYYKQYKTNPSNTNTVVMVYMPVDYQGGQYVYDDIAEIQQATVSINPATMRVVCVVDYPYTNNTQLFESIYGNKRNIPLVAAGFTGNEVDTAQTTTLNQFIDFVQNHYMPQNIVGIVVDRTVRPLWCVARDETSNSTMTIHDFANAVKNKNIPVLVFDAPMKSMVEVAYELRKQKTGVQYFIASQGQVQSKGFDYTALLQNIAQCISSAPQNVESAIAQSICNGNSYPVLEQSDVRSLVLIDMQQFENAMGYMSQVISACETAYATNPLLIDTARFASHFYYPIPWYVDWVGFLQSTGMMQLNDAIQNFNNCVVTKVMPANNVHSGLGIMFSTKTHEGWYVQTNDYQLDFINDFNWDDFLKNKHFGIYTDVYEPANDEPDGYVAMSINADTTQEFFSMQNFVHDPYDTDIYTININYTTGGIYRITPTSIQRLSNRINWQSISSSTDGMTLAACIDGGYIYTSSDGGTTWVERTSAGMRNWVGLTSSSDGQRIIAAEYGGYIYTSSDGGTTWNPISNLGMKNWSCIASSANGNRLIAAVNGGNIYIVTYSNNNWVISNIYGSQSNWVSVASSADGSIMLAAEYNGKISVYANSSWRIKLNDKNRQWRGLTISWDGTKVAGIADGWIYESTNLWDTYTIRNDAGNREWNYITYSWGQYPLALVKINPSLPVTGTLNINVTEIPENCEVIVLVQDNVGNVIANSGRSGLGWPIQLSIPVNEASEEHFFVQIIPVNIERWSMNTKKPYTIMFNYTQ